jgi:hypothetical protein
MLDLGLNSSFATFCNACVCIVALFFLFAASFVSAGESDAIDPAWQEWISGELELGLNAGRSDRDGDIEVDQLLRLKVDSPTNDRLHIRSTVWMTEDLDGRESSSSAFHTLNDTSSSFVTTRLLSLYLELEGEENDSRLRLGRQRIMDGVAFNRIDGVYFNARHNQLRFYAFLGARASVYENSYEDISTGAGVSWLPFRGTRMAADVFFGDDERRRFGSDEIEATLTTLSLRHSFNTFHNLFGRVTWYEGDLDEFQLTTQGVFQEDSLFYTLTYRKRVSTLGERPTDFPQFFYVVGELNGYEDVQGIVSVPLGERFELGFEAQVHDADDSTTTTSNRDFQRYGISLDVNQIATHYDARVIVEFWDADEGESEKTISAEVSRKWEHKKATIGVDYDRFQDRIIQFDPLDPDVFFIQSTDDIYSLYIRYEHEFNDQHSLEFRGSVEEDDTSDAPYWRLRTQYTYRF